MSRLIDADFVIDTVNEFKGKNRKTDLGIKLVEEIVSIAPTVDAEPIRHGHWNILTPQDDDGGWVAISCSNCNFVTPYASSRKEIEENGFAYHYCMYCGAKMEEIVDAGDENT